MNKITGCSLQVGLSGFRIDAAPFIIEMTEPGNPQAPRDFEFLTELKIDLARVLHGEQRFAYHAPAVVGDTLTFKSRVSGIFDKKGGAMTMVVVETEITNQRGAHVADTARTIVVRN